MSPNAAMLGMNVEMLNKGMKLTEDYIHPQDREKVIKTIINAVNSNVDDYTHEYRMVGDDGKLYYVANEITITKLSDEQFKAEFYIKNITESKTEDKANKDIKKKASKILGRKRKTAQEIGEENLKELITDDKVKLMMDTFTKLTGLYSVFVDVEGRIVFPPTGPATNLGDFYDLFEKPAYKEYYKHIKQTVLENEAPTIIDREEGGIGKLSAAPIRINNDLKGIWMVGSYTKEETAKLRKVYDSHWEIANMISEDLRMTIAIEIESSKSKGAGKKLLEELTRQSIVSDAMSKINSKLIDTVDQVIEETLRNVGMNMGIDKAGLYTLNSSKSYELRSFWNANGEAPSEDILVTLPDKMYMVERLIEDNDGCYAVDSTNHSDESMLFLMRFDCRAVIALPLYLADKMYGILFFAESGSERIWSSEELRFTNNMSVVIQNMLENAIGDDNIRNVNKHLIETYNSFNVGIFVRDAYSGEVLFSNKKMNELMGMDFTGQDSRMLLTDLHDKFDSLDGVRKPFITRDRVVNWRRYIQRLDDIMDVVEIQMEWLQGEPASLIILRKAKDL